MRVLPQSPQGTGQTKSNTIYTDNYNFSSDFILIFSVDRGTGHREKEQLQVRRGVRADRSEPAAAARRHRPAAEPAR